jgi:hypothetical protein
MGGLDVVALNKKRRHKFRNLCGDIKFSCGVIRSPIAVMVRASFMRFQG